MLDQLKVSGELLSAVNPSSSTPCQHFQPIFDALVVRHLRWSLSSNHCNLWLIGTFKQTVCNASCATQKKVFLVLQFILIFIHWKHFFSFFFLFNQRTFKLKEEPINDQKKWFGATSFLVVKTSRQLWNQLSTVLESRCYHLLKWILSPNHAHEGLKRLGLL